jgi:isoleucyl-tRNA synthetase
MAPVSPFFADWLYRNLNTATGLEKHDSVHLALFPDSDGALIDKALEQRMSYAQRISSLVLSLRKKESLRVRQPLTKVLIPILDEKFQTQVQQVEDLIIAEVNVKEIEYITDSAGVIKKKIKPNFKTLGKTLGKNMKDASKLIGAFTQDDITALEKDGSYNLSVNGESYDLSLSDFEISAEEIPGWQVAQDGDITVALDITLTDDLLAEGMARELVNRIQGIRRDTNLDVTDRINIELQDHKLIRSAVTQYGDYIKAEVLGDELTLTEMSEGTEIELPGDVKLLVGIGKV